MSGSLDHLIRMANQIAANLTHERDPTATMADHIRQFWDPRMKRMIFDHDGSGLSPEAAKAIAALKASA